MESREFARLVHELNHVLQVLTYRSERLLRSLEASDPARKSLEEMDADISRALPLIYQLVKDGEELYVDGPKAESFYSEAGVNENFEIAACANYKPSDSHKSTLLYVDDQAERLVVLRAVLESTGYNVLTAESGLTGLEKFLAEPIDLVVLDYYMPSMNGGALASKMRRLRPNVPIIIFSGALTLPELVIAMVDGFVSTSDEPEMLLQKISELLNPVQARAS